MSLPDNRLISSGRGWSWLAAPVRYAVLALAVAAMAWPSSQPATMKAGLSGSEWRVVEIGGQEASGAGTLRFTLTSIRGKTACGSFIGAFHDIGGDIEIAGLGVTRMLCDGRVDLERMFLDALAGARSYIMDGATLVLLDSTGKALVKLAG